MAETTVRMPVDLRPKRLNCRKEGVSKRSKFRKINRCMEAELAAEFAAVCHSSTEKPVSGNCDHSLHHLDSTLDSVSIPSESPTKPINNVDCNSDTDVSTDSSDSCVDSDCASLLGLELSDLKEPSVTFQKNSTADSREDPVRKGLREWAVLCNVPNTTLARLLQFLKPYLPSLPLHPSTLHLNSSPLGAMEKMGEGEFYYFGAEARLREMAEIRCLGLTFQLSFNVDGLPLFKSTNTDFWPIMCLVDGYSYPPFVWACWCGPGKPPLVEYFQKFNEELKSLLSNGLLHKDHVHLVSVKSFICDAPATAFIRNTVGHGAYGGCGKCTATGEHVGRMTFPTMSDQLRTDESFREQWHTNFHKGVTPLLELNFGLISCFPLDYLHLVCLGIMRAFLHRLTKSSKKINWTRQLSEANIERVNGRILSAASMWPRDFSRTPRGLQHLKRWKATEFRQFLLYLGPVVLRGEVLQKPFYCLFLLFHYGITLLIRKDLNATCIDEAEYYLRKFVKQCKSLLGQAFMTYNVHNLIHLAEDSRKFGPLDNFSAFPFENELQVLKNSVRGKGKPLQQLVRRIIECDRVSLLRQRCETIPDGVIPKSNQKKLTVQSTLFSKAQCMGRTISTLKGDNVVAVGDKIVCVNHFFVKNDTSYIAGKWFMDQVDLYKKPVKSSKVGIWKVSNLSHILRCCKLSAVNYKLVTVPLCDKVFAVYPLMN